MTQREKREVAAAVRKIMNDDCGEIRLAWVTKRGNLKGLRQYIRNECMSYWTDCNPYLDREYMDIAWFKVGKRIINLDDLWCFIRDGIKELSKQ